jgi:tetratricopeptide (TPR) repeat protein
MKKSMLFLIGLFVIQFSNAQELGKIYFPTSEAGIAQDYFIKGTLLLHSFEYEDAAEEFQEAQKISPDFVMAYWGEAMTHHHTLWGRNDKEEAQKILKKLGKTSQERLAKTHSKKEKDWLRAVDILFGEGEKKDREIMYSQHMLDMMEKYPGDNEIASFAALSILGTSHNGRDVLKYMRCAAIVEGVYNENPNHPGALHYLIHSYDDPSHAPLGMRAARRYAEVAPFANHALHMPSHIFIASGMWDDVVECNVASSSAADKRREKKGLGVDSRGFHALLWLHYGYLQKGQFEKARSLLKQMKLDNEESGSRRTNFHLSTMRAGYLVESGRWDDPVAIFDMDHDKLRKSVQAQDLYIQAMIKFKDGDNEGFNSALSKLVVMAPMNLHMDVINPGQPVTCCSPSYATGEDEESSVNHTVHIFNLELQSMKAASEGNIDEAIKLCKKAVEMESHMNFSYGPPIIVKPPYELLGELFLQKGDAKSTIAAINQGISRSPNRRISMEILMKAKKMLQTGAD